MSDSPRLSKNQRREAAREAARITREKQVKRERLLKWLVPTSVSVGLLAIAAVVIVVVVTAIPRPQLPAGPDNMASDGILFEAPDGDVVPVSTPGIAEESEPVATEFEASDDRAHIVTYIDWTCPACKVFEENYGAQIEQLVADGDATLEVHPVAILDRAYAGSRYSSRAANAAACVASNAPESFLDVQEAFFAGQPQEGTTGLGDDEMVDLIASAGVTDPAVTECVTDETYREWVTASTSRTTSDEALLNAQGGFQTPTLTVNGERWDSQSGVDFLDFVADKIG